MAGRRGAKERLLRAFTLVEMVVSIVIVSLMFVVAMNTLGASRAGLVRVADLGRARLLAEGLMSEVAQQSYWDPVTQGGLGPEASEAISGTRSDFDDVDDFDGWWASPPEERDGTVMADFAGWQSSVEVDWVLANDLETPRASETGLKRIIVRVQRGTSTLVELHAVRANLEAGS